jgi:hypothetical protein
MSEAAQKDDFVIPVSIYWPLLVSIISDSLAVRQGQD